MKLSVTLENKSNRILLIDHETLLALPPLIKQLFKQSAFSNCSCYGMNAKSEPNDGHRKIMYYVYSNLRPDVIVLEAFRRQRCHFSYFFYDFHIFNDCGQNGDFLASW